MRKSFLTQIRVLFITVFTAGIIWSCQQEKPEIHFPDPVIPQKEFKYLETITPDTLTFDEGDSAVFRMRTIPFNLLSRDSLTIQISDTAGAPYEFAEIKSYNLSADSIWSIVMYMKYGMKSGDIVSIMVADKDTVIYTDFTVLNMILKPVPKVYSLSILNNDITAYLKGGTATIRMRTQPWDMLFSDSTGRVSLIDTTGNMYENAFRIDSVRFQAADSTWNVFVKNTNKKTDSAFVNFRLDSPDTIMISRPVFLKQVAFSMSSVRVDNTVSMKYTSSTRTFTYCKPTTTDFSAQQFLFIHTGDKITVGDSVLENGKYNVLNANKTITVTVWKYDLHQDYYIKMTNTGLPIVRIDTKGQSVTRRDTWVPGITMRIEMPDGTVDYEGTMSLKGRGNGTWTETNKKPYGIKLDEKAKILGMHKNKRWILLANYKDRTLMRNDAALWLSRQTEMPYTISGEFVELVWNGQHMGNYYLCEQARIDNHRIDIHDPDLSDPAKGGFFMEIDAFLDYTSSDRADKGKDIGFWSTGANSRYKLPYIFKDPDEAQIDKSSAAYTYMVNFVKNMEDAIYGLKSNPNSNWQQYLDMDQAIDYALIQELTMNHDSYNTWPKAGPHSGFVYMDSAGVLCFGPCWDFDYHTFALKGDGNGGNWGWGGGGGGSTSTDNPRLTQWEILKMDNKGNNKYYFADLVKYDPKFKARLLERWNMYKNTWKEGFPAYVDQMADKIRASEAYNFSIWGLNNPNGNQNGDENLSFQEAIDNMKTAFLKRWQFMDENLKNL